MPFIRNYAHIHTMLHSDNIIRWHHITLKSSYQAQFPLLFPLMDVFKWKQCIHYIGIFFDPPFPCSPFCSFFSTANFTLLFLQRKELEVPKFEPLTSRSELDHRRCPTNTLCIFNNNSVSPVWICRQNKNLTFCKVMASGCLYSAIYINNLQS